MNSQKLIIFNDCSAFVDVTESAKELFSSGALDLYEIIISEQYESLIDSYESLERILENGGIIGIEAGFLNLNIGIETENDTLLLLLQEDGLFIETFDGKEWNLSPTNVDVSLSQNRVFDDENNLIQSTGISHNEQRVYAIDINNTHQHNSDLSDEEFIEIAEREGKVYTLKSFQDALNKQELSIDNNWVRFITIKTYL